MKAVLISIKPKWCELIASGEKTVEVRKTRPKLETPFKCYIYQTQGGGVIGEFVCDEMREYYPLDPKDNINKPYGNEIEKDSCLTSQQVNDYAIGRFGYGKLYAWHISNLVIYDQPKELSEFRGYCKEYDKNNPHCSICDGLYRITRPPQSWCYVEELKGENHV